MSTAATMAPPPVTAQHLSRDEDENLVNSATSSEANSLIVLEKQNIAVSDVDSKADTTLDDGGSAYDEGSPHNFLEKIEEFKSLGNVQFKGFHFEAATQLYSRGITMYDDHCSEQGEPEYISVLEALLNNRAACSIKLEAYGSAIQDADRVVLITGGKSPKGFYRRGCAYVALSKFPQALKDFQQAFALQPSAEARSRIAECQREVRQQRFAAAIRSERTAPLSESVDVSSMESNTETYSGPRFSESRPECLKEIVEYLRHNADNKLHKADAYKLVLNVTKLLRSTPTLVEIRVPEDKEITVCGDVHGQFYDLCNIFDINGLPSAENPYLFNGDFVDRGSFSTECILTLFAAKCLFPDHFFLARGNHETRSMNSLYGFQGEVSAKYDQKLYLLFCECFCLLPLAHTINGKIFVVHGGLFSRNGVTLKEIKNLDRDKEPADEGLMTEILWSDPQSEKGRAPSKRGVACCFGPDVTEDFLKTNNLDLVIRSHEMKENGYQEEHGGKLVTVFSAPNYCDQMGNKGAFVRLNGRDLKPKYTTFAAVPHPPVRPMQFANPIFSMM